MLHVSDTTPGSGLPGADLPTPQDVPTPDRPPVGTPGQTPIDTPVDAPPPDVPLEVPEDGDRDALLGSPERERPDERDDAPGPEGVR
ncbi:hypothetical protein [Truepera radiovictrix]|uniref:Uncharacterized protein n=1 Tax=Truepera radiovictrix (strain DSM 17093 / CIP 108686 / LMG 22925 / RQ-24) TaxID=649638 RepID=D7CT90_TRURR|nr:hypothetical protein [Truepera radiovictrix]ADI15553.1 hypothetical protein Trad_2444 [Truepera radiovictrix DSM 17093]WMT58818.1 hypothetical protein RCV51_07695 [Truepera radiovictrix]